jgi:hypothetical protein
MSRSLISVSTCGMNSLKLPNRSVKGRELSGGRH